MSMHKDLRLTRIATQVILALHLSCIAHRRRKHFLKAKSDTFSAFCDCHHSELYLMNHELARTTYHRQCHQRYQAHELMIDFAQASLVADFVIDTKVCLIQCSFWLSPLRAEARRKF
jgi:hypothetical protein